MRVGLSGFFLDKPMTGSGQYTLNLARELVHQVELTIFCPSEEAANVAKGLVGDRAVVVQVFPPTGGNPGKLWYEQIGLPWAGRRTSLDVLHVPYFGPPFFKPCPTVVTIHDLIMMALPQHRGSALVRLYTALAAASAKRAELTIADSWHTRGDVVRLLRIPEEKVRVIPLAVQGGGKPPSCEAVRARYRLPEKYVFYIGGLDWRKNVPTLMAAFSRLDGEWHLVIAGEPYRGGGRLFPNLAALAQKMGLEERVRFLGLVPEEDKPALYSLASLFVFPSRYEGFGLTPLEAMAWGTPVICSNATSLPEVTGNAALLFEPEDTEGLARLMQEVLSSPPKLRELSEKGLARAREFSWSKTLSLTLEAYRAAPKTALVSEPGATKGRA